MKTGRTRGAARSNSLGFTEAERLRMPCGVVVTEGMASAGVGADGRWMELPVVTRIASAVPMPVKNSRILQRSERAVSAGAKLGTGQHGQKGTVHAQFKKSCRCFSQGRRSVVSALLWLGFDNWLTTLVARAA